VGLSSLRTGQGTSPGPARARPSRISLTNAMIAIGVSYVLIVA